MMTTTDHEMLETIEQKLLQLNKDKLLGEISEGNFDFGMHNALAAVPTPALAGGIGDSVRTER